MSTQSFLEKFVKYPWLQKAWRYTLLTPLEVFAGAAIVGAILGWVRHDTLASRAGKIPLAFSEIERTTKDFALQNRPVPPLTKFYSLNNDTAMKVFESNNEALKISRSHSTFARELETRVDDDINVFPLITTYAKSLPGDAEAALRSLDKYVRAAEKLPGVNNAFASAWDEDHDHKYRTEYYDDCDTKGNCTKKSKQVYDHTIHTFTYYPQNGQNAARLLTAFVQAHPDLYIQEQLHLATRTEADNEYAIESSMRDSKFKGRLPTPEEYVALANTWANGSNLTKFTPTIISNHATMKNLSPVWNDASRTASSARYKTGSKTHSGPREFQVAEAALGHSQAAYGAIVKILSGIHFTAQKAPELDAKIKEFIGATLDGKPGNPKKLRKEVMQLARDLYEKNHEAGFDVTPYSVISVTLFTVLGMLIGAGLGACADHLLNKRRDRYLAMLDGEFARATGGTPDLDDFKRRMSMHTHKSFPHGREHTSLHWR